jgi:plastocyanin
MLALAVVAAASCSSDDNGTEPPPPDTTPASLTVAAGNNQTAEVGTALPQPFGARVANVAGTALANVTVSWAVESGGGTLASATSTTDGLGVAENQLVLGDAPGTNTVRATISGTALTATFTATATAPPPPADTVPAAIVIVSGDGQSGAVGSTLAPLEVRVTNAAGEGLAGVEVTFTVTSGGGQIVLGPPGPTNTAGVTAAFLQLGAEQGTNTVDATVSSNPELTVTFTATATAAAGTTAVDVLDNFFAPTTAQVGPGGSVRWTWGGNNQHNVTWVSGGFSNSDTQASGTHEVQFPSAGTFDYYCTIHGSPTSGMRGTIAVQ